MSNSVFYTIAIGFTSGFFLRSFFDAGIVWIAVLVVIALACASVWRSKERGSTSPLFLASLCVLACAVGMFRMDVDATQVSLFESRVGEEIVLEGKVVREPEARANTTHLYIEPSEDGVSSNEKVLVYLDRFATTTPVAYGDVVRVSGSLSLPEAFETDGGRTFAYPEYLRTKGVLLVMYRPMLVAVEEGTPSPMRTLFALKYSFMRSVERILPEPHAGLGEGLLLGVKRALGENLEEAFRETGIIHIVVLSGYNIIIVVEAILALLAYVCRPRSRMYVALVWIVLFALLVGMSATVVRASIMAALVLIVRTMGRTYMVLRGLMLAGVTMLLINPHLLVHDPGFQLSFLATLGLILFAPSIESALTAVPLRFGLRSIVTATLATQFMVLPLLLYQTGMLSIVSVLVNVLVLPAVPFAMLFTFLAGALGGVLSVLGNIFGWGAYVLLEYIVNVATWFAGLPLASATLPAFPFWLVVLGYVGITLTYLRVAPVDAFPAPQPSAAGQGENDYADWVIEEENTGRRSLQTNASRTVRKVKSRSVVTNDYKGWVIEAAKETEQDVPEEAQDASSGTNEPLPFR